MSVGYEKKLHCIIILSIAINACELVKQYLTIKPTPMN